MKITAKTLRASTAIALLISGAIPAVADVRASVSQDSVALGDHFTLSLDVSGPSDGVAPDLSVLQKDFKVEGTGQSSMTNVVNGAVSETHSWKVTLSPRQTGTLSIPAIRVGAESSKPLTVNVGKVAQMPRADFKSAGIQVEMTVPKGTYYVQQEIPVKVRIVDGLGLRKASISDPEGKDVVVSQSGEDKISRDTIDGKPTNVIERTYLVKPQRSGLLQLSPAVLRGVVDDPNARRSPFGGDEMFDQIEKMFSSSGFGSSGIGDGLFDDILNPGREIVARSQPISIDVQAKPGQQTSWFLPAKSVKILSEWQPSQPTFRVGEATKRIVQIVADGASKEQLPDLKFGDADGALIYVDRVDDKSIDKGGGTTAIKQYTLSVVPTRGGSVSLPEVAVQWLDSSNGAQKTAKLAATKIDVEGAAPAVVSDLSAQKPAVPSTDQVATRKPSLGDHGGLTDDRLAIISGALLALLIASGLAVLWRRRVTVGARLPLAAGIDASTGASTKKRLQDGDAPQKASAIALRAACKNNDAEAAMSNLNKWLAAGGIDRRRLSSPQAADLKAATNELEAHLYGGSEHGRWNGRALLKAFDALAVKSDLRSGELAKTGNLPPLYPQQSVA